MKAASGPLASTAAGQLLRRMFDAAVASAQPSVCVPPHVPDPSELGAGGRLVVVGAGKASAAMAQAVEQKQRLRHRQQPSGRQREPEQPWEQRGQPERQQQQEQHLQRSPPRKRCKQHH